MSDLLSPAELHELTGKKYKPAQIRVLNKIGCDYKERADGSLIVHRAVRDACLGVLACAKVSSEDAHSEPVWTKTVTAQARNATGRGLPNLHRRGKVVPIERTKARQETR